MMENPVKMDDLGVPLFSETSIFNMFSNVHPENWGNMMQFDLHFSTGLVQPPSSE